MRIGFLLLALLLGLLLSLWFSLSLGPAGFLSPAALWSLLHGLASSGLQGGAPSVGGVDLAAILWMVRLPRCLLGLLAGANLALSGLLMQALFRNPLADSYVAGVASGAGLGAISALTLGVPATFFGINATCLAAFSGALLVSWGVYRFAYREAGLSPSALLLTGMALGAITQALSSFLLLRSETTPLRSALAWLFGSLAYRDWMYVGMLLPYTLLGILCCGFLAPRLNLLAMGEVTAHHLGLRVGRFRVLLLVLASLLAASTVAACGVIGFVGLVVPNLMRACVGANHRRLLPVTVLAGGLLLSAADVVTRLLFPREELPVGLLTGLFGGVFFLKLLQNANAALARR